MSDEIIAAIVSAVGSILAALIPEILKYSAEAKRRLLIGISMPLACAALFFGGRELYRISSSATTQLWIPISAGAAAVCVTLCLMGRRLYRKHQKRTNPSGNPEGPTGGVKEQATPETLPAGGAGNPEGPTGGVKGQAMPETLSAGGTHTVGVLRNSAHEIIIVGNYQNGQCEALLRNQLANWRDIVAVAGGGSRFAGHTVGLRKDGRVVAMCYDADNYGQCDVKEWTDIVAVAAGYSHTVGLRADGTVVATGATGTKVYRQDFGQCDVGEWTGIIAVSAGFYHTVGLRADGRVVAAGPRGGNYNYGQCDVENWQNIIAVSAGGNHTVGLCKDGTVLIAGGEKNSGAFKLHDKAWQKQNGWNDIVSVSAGGYHAAGLREDGTVVTTPGRMNREFGGNEWKNWRNIVAISAGGFHTVALDKDGGVFAIATGPGGQCDCAGTWNGLLLQPGILLPDALTK